MAMKSACLLIGLILWGLSAPVQSAKCFPADRQILLKFKSGLREFRAAWNTPDCCKWQGITCNKAGRVIGLQMWSIGGVLSSEISKLKNLQILKLSNGKISGPIPASLGKLTNLQELSLDDNKLSGAIPSELGHLTNLQLLDLSSNSLTGKIPDSFGYLSNLQTLKLQENNLAGPLPRSLGKLSKLEFLFLYNNPISGTIPTSFKGLKSLDYFWASGTRLAGPLPDIFGQLKNLSNFHIYDNAFLTGPLPPLSAYEKFDAHNSSISGAISKFPDSIQVDLRDTKITSIPADLSAITRLSIVRLSGNKLTFEGIKGIGTISGPRTIELSGCGLKGSIPSWLSKINLAWPSTGFASNGEPIIDLSFNSISGSIPDFSHMETLEKLDLHHNSLSGTIPSSFVNNSMLKYLDLSSNQLSGSIPPSFVNLPAISFLDLSHNKLTGKIPQGGALNNFNASSYAANAGLCGSPLPAC